MAELLDILGRLQRITAPVALATVLQGERAGVRRILAPEAGTGEELDGATRAVMAAGRPQLLPTGELVEPVVPGRLPPWMHFCAQLLRRGETGVLATVGRVSGDLAYAVGDRFAYDARHHGLLPMDGRFSLELQRACDAARASGGPAWRRFELPSGSLDMALEPFRAVPAVILAAGASRRLGRPKQLVRLGGESLLRRAARAALAGCAPVLVVLGCRAEEMAPELEGLAVTPVLNAAWEEGMASSIRAGLRALPQGAEAVLFLVCDQVAVDGALVGRLLEVRRDHPEAVIACGYAGARGTPSVFPARCFGQLLELRGDRGARDLLGDAVEVPFPAGDQDVDLPGHLPDLT